MAPPGSASGSQTFTWSVWTLKPRAFEPKLLVCYRVGLKSVWIEIRFD